MSKSKPFFEGFYYFKKTVQYLTDDVTAASRGTSISRVSSTSRESSISRGTSISRVSSTSRESSISGGTSISRVSSISRESSISRVSLTSRISSKFSDSETLCVCSVAEQSQKLIRKSSTAFSKFSSSSVVVAA